MRWLPFVPQAVTALAILFVVFAPETAHACAACFDPKGETRLALIVTTGFLTFMPLAVIGGVVYYLRRRAREVGQAESGVEA